MKKLQGAILLFALSLLVFLPSINVSAGGVWSQLNKEQKSRAKELYGYIISKGYSDYAAAGICGNADAESTFGTDSDTYDFSKAHVGVFQFETEYWSTYESWAKSKHLDNKVPKVEFQWIKAGLKKDFDTYASISLADYKKCTDIVTGVEGFMIARERCIHGTYAPQKVKPKISVGEKYQDGDLRIKYAKSIYKALKGTDPETDDSNKDPDKTPKTKQEITNKLLSLGYTEDQISSYFRLGEMNVEEKYLMDTKRNNLDQNSVQNLANWERNVNNNKRENGFIAKLRVLTMIIGIFFILWVILIYMAYWFDKINSLWDLDLLGKLTFNALHVSETEEECTFKFNDFSSTKRKTVNHKAILCICVIGIVFGLLIFTGEFYRLISNLVNYVLRVLHMQ